MLNKNKSLMFIPAKKKMLEKASECKADAIIFDLEDSILDVDKDEALHLLNNYLETFTYNINSFVRVNLDRIEIEMEKLSKFPINGYMIPKTENDKILIENELLVKDKKIIALIETSKGFVNIENIAKSDRIHALAFGAEDYTMEIGMQNTYMTTLFARSQIVMYGRAFNKAVYDTPSFNYYDIELLENEVSLSVDLGFDGKMAIHPNQIEVINKMFSDFDYNYMEYIISEYENSSEAVMKIDGKIYEIPHIKRLKKIIDLKKKEK